MNCRYGVYGVLFNVLALSIILLLIPSLGVGAARGELAGSWESDLALSPQTPLQSLDSSFQMTYALGKMTISSESRFSIEGYDEQKFEVDYLFGPTQMESSISFDPSGDVLEFFKTKSELPLENYELEGTFLLEHVEESEGFAPGLEVEVLGPTAWDGAFRVTNMFGMERELAESLGLESGSGYSIVNPATSQLEYRSTTVDLTGFSVGPSRISVSTEMSIDKGFEYTEFHTQIRGASVPVTFVLDLRFESQTGSVELDPKVRLDWVCFEVHTDLTTPNVDDVLEGRAGDSKELTGLELEGFSITELELGQLTFSSTTALKGSIYRLLGRSDLTMRAGDYVLDPDPDYDVLYEKTPYQQVFSVQGSFGGAGSSMGLDVYTKMDQGLLFDIAKVTGTGKHAVNRSMALDYGAVIDSGELEEVRMGFQYSF